MLDRSGVKRSEQGSGYETNPIEADWRLLSLEAKPRRKVNQMLNYGKIEIARVKTKAWIDCKSFF